MPEKIDVTIGICAYNEVMNIEGAIRSAFDQKLHGFSLSEVVVVSSGSTDGTDDVVLRLMNEYPDLRLIPQAVREGKNSAVNCFLDNKDTDIVVILNADNTFGNSGSLQKLLEPFSDPTVGIVGGRPIPTNDRSDIAGFASHTLWIMHHNISLVKPKIGELVAFRDIGTRLSLDSQSDEDLMKMKLEEAGYRSAYAPEALVFNRGPETIHDFIKQRTRVNIGECYVKKNHDYDIPTWDVRLLFVAFMDSMKDLGFHPLKIIITAILEIYSRAMAKSHIRHDKGDMSIWDPVKSTKKL